MDSTHSTALKTILDKIKDFPNEKLYSIYCLLSKQKVKCCDCLYVDLYNNVRNYQRKFQRARCESYTSKKIPRIFKTVGDKKTAYMLDNPQDTAELRARKIKKN